MRKSKRGLTHFLLSKNLEKSMRWSIMFEVGDLMMHGARGVCKIKNITELDWDVAEKGRQYYVIEPVFKGDTFYAPVGNDRAYQTTVRSKNL